MSELALVRGENLVAFLLRWCEWEMSRYHLNPAPTAAWMIALRSLLKKQKGTRLWGAFLQKTGIEFPTCDYQAGIRFWTAAFSSRSSATVASILERLNALTGTP
ncbi:MAG: hypothetical protein BWY82_01144 [Verrucomicrobia bacterium ADurb.Bin474]|nr:MAG: hypothetical protein BWY82_01144 [Verrucomicrobia bacterium ADurb.Bin474]